MILVEDYREHLQFGDVDRWSVQMRQRIDPVIVDVTSFQLIVLAAFVELSRWSLVFWQARPKLWFARRTLTENFNNFA